MVTKDAACYLLGNHVLGGRKQNATFRPFVLRTLQEVSSHPPASVLVLAELILAELLLAELLLAELQSSELSLSSIHVLVF